MLYIVEHGDTAWAQTRQHEGLTDLPLSSRGQDAARNQHHVRLYCQAMGVLSAVLLVGTIFDRTLPRGHIG